MFLLTYLLVMPMTAITAYQPAHYEHISPGCVLGADIVKHKGKTVQECEELCDAMPTCLAFEYGVNHGGSDTAYDTNDCQLQSSKVTEGCDGARANLDLYIKLPPIADMPGQITYTEYVGYKCHDRSANLIDYWDCESNDLAPMESLFRFAYDEQVLRHQRGIQANITGMNFACERACEMHGDGCAGFTAIDEEVWIQKLQHPERLHSCGDLFYECKLYSSCFPWIIKVKPFWVHVTRTIEDYCHAKCWNYPGDWSTKCSYAPCGACTNCN